jgi:hypothetical protein
MPRPIILTSKRLIQRNGKDVNYTKETIGEYDPELSTVVGSTSVNTTVRVYKTDVTYKESQSPNLIGKESCVFLLAGYGLTFTPEISDKISDGTVYEVLMLSKVEVNDTVALWRLVCVRS